MRSASSAGMGAVRPNICGVEGRIDIMTGTLGKALGGASGGYTSAKREVVDWLRQRSRPYLFSNTLAPVITAASLKVFDLIDAGDTLRARLYENAALFRREMTRPRLHVGRRGASDHPGHAGRCGAGAGNGGADAGERVCDRLLLPGRAEGAGADTDADVGGAFEGGCGAGDCGVCRGGERARCDLRVGLGVRSADESFST